MVLEKVTISWGEATSPSLPAILQIRMGVYKSDVCVREGEGETDRERQREKEKKRERERERESGLAIKPTWTENMHT